MSADEPALPAPVAEIPGDLTALDMATGCATLLGGMGLIGAATLAFSLAMDPVLASYLAAFLALVLVFRLRLGAAEARLLERALVLVRWLPPPPDAKTRHALPAVERKALPGKPADTGVTQPPVQWQPLVPAGCSLSQAGATSLGLGLATLG